MGKFFDYCVKKGSSDGGGDDELPSSSRVEKAPTFGLSDARRTSHGRPIRPTCTPVIVLFFVYASDFGSLHFVWAFPVPDSGRWAAASHASDRLMTGRGRWRGRSPPRMAPASLSRTCPKPISVNSSPQSCLLFSVFDGNLGMGWYWFGVVVVLIGFVIGWSVIVCFTSIC